MILHPDKEEILPLGEFEHVQPEARGFSLDQMVACEACLRANPPTRMHCLYCGKPLPSNEATDALRRPMLRRLEEGEQGFNVILMPEGGAANVAEESLTGAASLLRCEPEQLREMIEAGLPLPLARAASGDEAALIERRLSALHFRTEIIPDETLAIESLPPLRIRKLELSSDRLTGWTAGQVEAQSIAWTEIVALIVGRIFTKRVEVEERRGRWGKQSEVVEAREFDTDEAVLDIYTTGDHSGWRIMTGSFDFSCLGQRKSLLGRENFARLTETLQTRAPSAYYDASYWQWRRLLTIAWPLTQHTESRGLRRDRPGRFNVEALTTTSNEAQFTRYGRLRYYLEKRQRSPQL